MTKKLFGIITIISLIGFLLITCSDSASNGYTSSSSGSITYSGYVESQPYTLMIYSSNRAAYKPRQGDSYVLYKGSVSNSGTVQVAGTNLTLKPNGSTNTFIISIQGNSISAITGNITLVWSDNSTTVFGTGNPGTGNPGTGNPGIGKQAMFIAVGRGRNSLQEEPNSKLSYSIDGITWTEISNNNIADLMLSHIIYGGDKWIVSDSYGKLAYSADGFTWTKIPRLLFNGEEIINDITWGNGVFVAVGGTGHAGVTGFRKGRIAYSYNGINWTEVTDTGFGNRNIRSVAYGDGMFIAAGESNSQYQKTSISYDGVTWVPGAGKFDSTELIDKIVYYNGMWLAPNSSYGIYTSDNNGETWKSIYYTSMQLSSGVSFFDIAWGGGRYVVVGMHSNRGIIAHSTDGVNWTPITNTPFGSNSVHNVVYGNGIFVATNISSSLQSKVIMYSTDGITWTTATNSTFESTLSYSLNTLMDIAFGNYTSTPGVM